MWKFIIILKDINLCQMVVENTIWKDLNHHFSLRWSMNIMQQRRISLSFGRCYPLWRKSFNFGTQADVSKSASKTRTIPYFVITVSRILHDLKATAKMFSLHLNGIPRNLTGFVYTVTGDSQKPDFLVFLNLRANHLYHQLSATTTMYSRTYP